MGDIQGSSVLGVNYSRRKLPGCNYQGIIVWEAIALGGYCPGEGEQLLGGNCPVFYLTLIFEKNLKVLITQFKVRLSPFKKICVVCLIESPLEMMKNAFYFL